MNTILRLIYRSFAAKFQDFLVEDFVGSLPSEVKKEYYSLLNSQKKTLQRANDFLAFQLHRRMAIDPKNSERYQGMFMQLRIMDAILMGRPDETPAKRQKKKADVFDYDTTITDFLERGKAKNSNTQE